MAKTKGWQSGRFCEYPQEIGLVFDGVVNTRQIQFLSHQSKIASKIELFVDCFEDDQAVPDGEVKEAVDVSIHKLYTLR